MITQAFSDKIIQRAAAKILEAIYEQEFRAKLQGYNNYYGLIGNYSSLSKVYEHVKTIPYKLLNRKSQRRNFNLV